MKELELAQILREKLAPNFREIYCNINIASNKFYPDWEKWHGRLVPCAQPQIDLLLVDENLRLLAAELKWFRKTKRGQVNLPFYAGIDEALALLRLGFQTVSLWHFFDKELELEQIRRLYRNCDSLIDNLGLPINYQACRVTKAGAGCRFWGFHSSSTVQLEGLPSAYGKSNPLRSNSDAQRIQDFIRSVLRIPQPR